MKMSRAQQARYLIEEWMKSAYVWRLLFLWSAAIGLALFWLALHGIW